MKKNINIEVLWAVKTGVSCGVLPFVKGQLCLFSFLQRWTGEWKTDLIFFALLLLALGTKSWHTVKIPSNLWGCTVFFWLLKKLTFHPNNCLFHIKGTWKPAQWSGGVCCEQREGKQHLVVRLVLFWSCKHWWGGARLLCLSGAFKWELWWIRAGQVGGVTGDLLKVSWSLCPRFG